MGARVSVTGMASHHHTAAIVLKDTRRSVSGVRREIGSVLLNVVRRLAGRRRSAKHSFHAITAFLTRRLYYPAIKLRDCWTKSKLSVMGIHGVFAAIGTHLNGITGRVKVCRGQTTSRGFYGSADVRVPERGLTSPLGSPCRIRFRAADRLRERLRPERRSAHPGSVG